MFPWRQTHDPYRICVSEVMLQQTQAPRVAPRYVSFTRLFPSWPALAGASTHELLAAWSGLGYNRRALALRELAREVLRRGGTLPSGQDELEELPGIGPATAAAIRAFAFEQQSVYLDTNVRGVYIHEFFPRRRKVRDDALVPLVEQTFVRGRAREWYYALLDYGAWLKSQRRSANPTRRSAHYHRAPTFVGSSRQLRGQIVRAMLVGGTMTSAQVAAALGVEERRVRASLESLKREGFLRRRRQAFALAD